MKMKMTNLLNLKYNINDSQVKSEDFESKSGAVSHIHYLISLLIESGLSGHEGNQNHITNLNTNNKLDQRRAKMMSINI